MKPDRCQYAPSLDRAVSQTHQGSGGFGPAQTFPTRLELAAALAALGAGREVPPELYRAVAEVIAWVYSLEKKAQA